jgi:outer membrane protein TolC
VKRSPPPRGRPSALATTLGAALGLAALSGTSAALAEELSPAAALALAARQNLELRASLAELRSAEASVDAASGARVPVLFASGSGGYTERSRVQEEGLAISNDKTLSTEAGLRFFTDLGTTVEVGAGTGLSFPGALTTTFEATLTENSPSTTASVFVNVRQPLLRGGGTDAVLASERQAEASLAASRASQEQAASEVARDVLLAYWELWYADRALALQEASRALAVRQRDEAAARESQLGTTSRREVLRFEAELRSVDASLAQARVARTSAALSLGRLLGLERDRAVALSTTADEPPSSRAAGGRAPGRTPEIEALAEQVRGAEHRVAAADDAAQPRLDLGLNASASTLFTEDRTGGTTGLPSDRPAFVGLVTLDFELPLGDSQADAQHRQAVSDLEAARARLASRELALRADQAALAAELDASSTKVAAATDTAALQAQLAEAERQALELGTSTTFEVVRTQQDARQAELSRMRAVVDAENASVRYLHGQGTLLARAGGFAREVGR